MKKIVIAIDGYSGCGKSTLARQLARRLHYTYLDSGAMYRAITLYFIRNRVDCSDQEQLSAALKNIAMEFRDHGNGSPEIRLNGEDVTRQIREMAVTGRVSKVAAIPEVREFAVKQQREMSLGKGVVMDGRDVGTTVFPDAALKIFMTADMDTRAARRFKEMQEKKENISLEEIKENLATRDYLDTHRAVSPLQQAKDAVILDNTHLTEEEQLQYALNLVKEIGE